MVENDEATVADDAGAATVAESPDVQIQVPAPLDHQVRIIADDRRYKVLRAGRRAGKTRTCFYCAVVGHGSVDRFDGEEEPARPRWRGIIHGLDVAWVCPTEKQSDPLWVEEIRPRFDGKAGVKVNDVDRFVEIAGAGRLFVRTEKNVATIRGQGRKLGGVIFDEGAHYDLSSMYLNIVRWAMMDNEAWAIFSSTSNSGHDGNHEQLLPSYFNRICQQIDGGDERLRPSKLWASFYFTALDNPKISRIEFLQVLDEISLEGGGQKAIDEEGYAKLLPPGTGLGFPEWRRSLHVRPGLEPDAGWGCLGTLDWGHASPGAFYELFQGPAGKLLLKNEVYFNGLPRPDWPKRRSALEVGEIVGNRMIAFRQERIRRHKEDVHWPEYVAGDSSMWAITGAGDTLAALFQKGLDAAFADEENQDFTEGRAAPQLLPAPKGPGSRAARKEMLHEALAWTGEDADGNPTAESDPLLAVGDDCPNFIRCIAQLPLDPKGKEDVDTTAEDHAYDSATYGLHALVPEFDDSIAGQRKAELARAKLDGLSQREAGEFDDMVETIARGGSRRRQ